MNKKCRFCGLYDNQVNDVMRNIDKDSRIDELSMLTQLIKSNNISGIPNPIDNTDKISIQDLISIVLDRIKELEEQE